MLKEMVDENHGGSTRFPYFLMWRKQDQCRRDEDVVDQVEPTERPMIPMNRPLKPRRHFVYLQFLYTMQCLTLVNRDLTNTGRNTELVN